MKDMTIRNLLVAQQSLVLAKRCVTDAADKSTIAFMLYTIPGVIKRLEGCNDTK